MSHFYGGIHKDGSKDLTKAGTKATGLSADLRSYTISVSTNIHWREEGDRDTCSASFANEEAGDRAGRVQYGKGERGEPACFTMDVAFVKNLNVQQFVGIVENNPELHQRLTGALFTGGKVFDPAAALAEALRALLPYAENEVAAIIELADDGDEEAHDEFAAADAALAAAVKALREYDGVKP